MIPRILIFATINLVYGRDTLKTANKFCDAHLKKVRLQETLRFNKKCKKNNILPASLLQPPPTKTRKGFRIAENNAKKILNEFIQDGYRKIRNCNKEIDRIRQSLFTILPHCMFNDLQDVIITMIVNFRYKTKSRLMHKYDSISCNELKNLNTRNKI